MQTRLAPEFKATAAGNEAAGILRSCVHCGFCTATCPTYQLLGDELDGPRGRIHLIKQVLEGEAPSARTQLHLDRCLTCRACETTCPSGVQFGRLLDIGRQVVEEKVPRSFAQRLFRRALAAGLTGPLFAPLVKLGQGIRPLLPASMAARIPRPQTKAAWPTATHPRQMLLLDGCVQPAIAPNINAALARILDRLGITLRIEPAAGCCGAIRHHLVDTGGALEDIRRNIDAWWPQVEAGVEAIISTASGCGTQLREYGHLLRDDPRHADKAARITALARDPAELLPALANELRAIFPVVRGERVVFQSPCSLQHGLKIRGAVEALLSALGAELVPVEDAHLCCGSAGTYSLLQTRISRQLGRNKAAALTARRPEVILSANIGCISQMSAYTDTPVRHWVEWIDARLNARGPSPGTGSIDVA